MKAGTSPKSSTSPLSDQIDSHRPTWLSSEIQYRLTRVTRTLPKWNCKFKAEGSGHSTPIRFIMLKFYKRLVIPLVILFVKVAIFQYRKSSVILQRLWLLSLHFSTFGSETPLSRLRDFRRTPTIYFFHQLRFDSYRSLGSPCVPTPVTENETKRRVRHRNGEREF